MTIPSQIVLVSNSETQMPDLSRFKSASMSLAYITIDMGQTRISTTTRQGDEGPAWTASFGWVSLLDLPLQGGSHMPLSFHGDVDLLKTSLTGQARVFSEIMDTAPFIENANQHIAAAIANILQGTLGAAAGYEEITLAGPDWLHPALEQAKTLRPNFSEEFQSI